MVRGIGARRRAIASSYLITGAALAAVGVIAAPDDGEALVTPDTVSPTSVIDTQNTRPMWVGLGIRNSAGTGGGTCTGLLINPRTVLFAGHCVDNTPQGQYNAEGSAAAVAYTTDPTFGIGNLRNWLFNSGEGDGRVMNADSVFVWYDPRALENASNGGPNGAFLSADVAIAGFDAATELLGRDAADGIGILLSPLSGPTNVQIGGYGQSGNGLSGARASTFQRRLGNNVLGFLGSDRDLTVAVYGGTPDGDLIAAALDPAGLVYQDMYWVDFDDPQRGVRSPPYPLDFDVLPGNAVAGEAITAAGDSGSPLVTSQFGRDVSVGVLSQGTTFFSNINGQIVVTPFSNFGTVGGYTPLYLFWDQIVINNPYKYVQATQGDGEWTDPNHWVQEVDPLYFTLAGNQLVNELPDDPALSVSVATPNFGDPNANPNTPSACDLLGLNCPVDGATAEPGDAFGDANAELPGVVNRELPGIVELADDYGNNTALPEEIGEPGGDDGENIPEPPATNEAASTLVWGPGNLINVSTGALTGPGTTGFVPDNVIGPVSLQNSTRWFEVNLRNAGTTFLTGAEVSIDRLSVRGPDAGLYIRDGARLNTTLSSFVDDGVLTVDGVFSPRLLQVVGGQVRGQGRIIAPDGVIVSGGVISPGAAGAVGTLGIEGNLEIADVGAFGIDVMSDTSADVIDVDGAALLGGVALVNYGYAPSVGDRWTILTATGPVTGAFDASVSNLSGLLFSQFTVSDNSLILQVLSFPFVGLAQTDNEEAIAIALDGARTNPALDPFFDVVNPLSPEDAADVLAGMVPVDAFAGGLAVRANTENLTRTVLERVGGEAGISLFAGAGAGPVQLAALSGDTLSDAGQGVAGRPLGSWSTYLVAENFDGDVIAAGQQGATDGTSLIVGADRAFGEVRAGVAGQYADTSSTFQLAALDAKTLQGAAYVSWVSTEGPYAILALTAGQTELDGSRVAGSFTPQSSTEATTLGWNIAFGHIERWTSGFGAAPELSLSVLNTTIDGYTESSPAGLAIDERTVGSAIGRLGGSVFHSFDFSDLTIQPRIGAHQAFQFGAKSDKIDGALALASEAIVPTLSGDDADDNWWEFSGGVEAKYLDRIALSFAYETSAGRTESEVDSLRAGLRVIW